jgi:hypothetical protein
MGMGWIQVAWKWTHWKHNNEPTGSINGEEFLDHPSNYPLLHSSSHSLSVRWAEVVGGENLLRLITNQQGHLSGYASIKWENCLGTLMWIHLSSMQDYTQQSKATLLLRNAQTQTQVKGQRKPRKI